MMKIILLVAILLAVAPVGVAQLFSNDLDFEQESYEDTEGTLVRIRLTAALNAVNNFNGSIEVDVEVAGMRGCTPGADFTLSSNNRNLVTVNFTAGNDFSSFFTVNLTCDGVLEGPEVCSLTVTDIRIPIGAPFDQDDPQDADDLIATTLSIDNCPTEGVICSWENETIFDVTERLTPLVILHASCRGRSIISVSIGVRCSGISAQIGEDMLEPALQDFDWTVNGSTLQFPGTGEDETRSEVPIFVTIVNDDIAEPRESLICNFLIGVGEEVQSENPRQVTIAINDDDALEIFWAKDLYVFDESDEDATTELLTNSTFLIDVNIVGVAEEITENVSEIMVLGSSISIINFREQQYGVGSVERRRSQSDVLSGSVAFLFEANTSSSLQNFTIVDDNICEFDELVMATFGFSQGIASTFNARQGSPNVTYMVIRDNDNVTLGFPEFEEMCDVFETDSYVSIYLRIVGRFFVPVTVNVTCTSDTAMEGEDYDFMNISITFPLESSARNAPDITNSSTIMIPIRDDHRMEGRECFNCSIESYSIPCPVLVDNRTKMICINDPEDVPVPVRFNPASYSVTEGMNINAEITLEALADHTYDFNVTVVTRNGNAIRDSDFRGMTFMVTFPAGRNLTSFLVPILNDEAVECPEEFFLDLQIPAAAAAIGIVKETPDTATVNIADDDVATVSFNPQNYTVNEGNPANLMIVLDKGSPKNITVAVTTMDITATDGEDYTGRSSSILIPAEELGRTYPISTMLDNLVESAEFFQATLSLPAEAGPVVIGTPDVAFVGINDATMMIPVRFNPDTYFVTEGVDGNANITLEALGNHDDFPFTVIVVPRDGSAIAGEDYTGENIQVTFPPGDNVVSFPVPIRDDEVAECPEQFFLDLEIPQAAADMGVIKGMPDTATVNIADEDDVVVSFSPQNYTVPEGTPAELMIVLDRKSAKNITCSVTTMDITATSPDDYTGGSIPFTVPADIMINVTVPVSTNRDILCDDDESFKATISCDQTPLNIEVGPDSYVTILDTTVPVQFNPTVYTVTEGDSAAVTVTVVALRDHEFPFNVTVNITDGTAGSGSDYGGPQMITVMFLAGDNSVDFTIPIVNNGIAECPEDFSLRLVIPQSTADMGVVTKSDATSVVNILDEDVVTVSFSPQNYTVPEGTPAELMIVLDRESAKDITCNLITMDITAISPDDYTGGTVPFTIPAGITKVTLPVSTNRDSLCDGDETFKTNISCDQTPLNMEIGPASCVTITDATVPVQFNPTVYTVTEGDSAVVTVTLEALKDHEFPFSVTVNTMDGTAGSGSDYGGPQMITVMFPAGQNSVDSTIPIVNNDIAECPEDFFLQLEIPQSAANMGVVTKSNDTAVVTILDDDVLIISLTSNDYTVKENEGPVNIVINASRPAEFPYNVTLRTEPSVDGLAKENKDYLPGQFNIVFSPGTTVGSQPITIVDDNVTENVESIAPCVYNSMEYFLVRISISQESVEKGLQVDTPEARVTIMDNDVVISFADASYVTDEDNEGGIPITIVGCGDVSTAFTIPLTVTGGTATEVIDYMRLPGSVEFPALVGDISFQFIPICDDVVEVDENAALIISVPMTEQHRVALDIPNTNVMIIEGCPEIPPGKFVNDTVMADPVFTVPIYTQNTSDLQECFPMCYEVHGRNGTYFNFISDNCTSVNAYYIEAIVREAGNVIREIGVVATDNTSACHYVQVTVNDDGACLTQVDGQALDSGMEVINDIRVYHTSSLVRISVPNCSQMKHLAMWIRCQRLTLKVHSNQVPITFEQPLIKYVVSRGLKDRPLAHGLIGQFWGVPFDVVPLPDGNYSLTMMPLHPDVPSRTIYASMGHFTWTLNHVAALPGRCFYVGTSQAGPWPEEYDSVIQGNYEEYIVHDGLFSTIWTYSQYTAATCGN